jgi:hypothetical protein
LGCWSFDHRNTPATETIRSTTGGRAVAGGEARTEAMGAMRMGKGQHVTLSLGEDENGEREVNTPPTVKKNTPPPSAHLHASERLYLQPQRERQVLSLEPLTTTLKV